MLVPVGRRPDEETARAEETNGVSPDLLALEREIKIARDAYVKASDSRADSGTKRPRSRSLSGQRFDRPLHGTRGEAPRLSHGDRGHALDHAHGGDELGQSRDGGPRRLISVLRDHYVANADVDLLIDEFPHGDTPLEAESLLRKIAAESPHDYVRATALFELAEVLRLAGSALPGLQRSAYDKNLDAMIAMQSRNAPRNWMRSREKQGRPDSRMPTGERGMKAMTTEAERLYDQVVTQFPDVRRPGPAVGRA